MHVIRYISRTDANMHVILVGNHKCTTACSMFAEKAQHCNGAATVIWGLNAGAARPRIKSSVTLGDVAALRRAWGVPA